MKITICGSIAFYKEMEDIKALLEKMGHEVKIPPSQVKDESGKMIPIKDYYTIRKITDATDGWIWDRKAEAIRWHFEKVAWADAVLVLNYTKNNVTDYIGGNTLIEIGVAFYLNKPIYLYNSVPTLPYTEEIRGMKPVLINGDLKLIK